MNSERCSQCKHFIIANAGEGKIYGCDRSKCVFEPTTKNDLAVEKTNMIDKSNFSQEQYKADLQSAYDCGYNQACKDKITMPYAIPDNCGNYIEQTTMSDLGVDCISRADVLKLMQDNWHTHNGDWAMQESMDDIRALPSVTPQPRKGHWILGGYDDYYYICDKCKFKVSEYYAKSTYNFCPSCGADMREVKE